VPRSPRPSSKAISSIGADLTDPTLRVNLEFQVPLHGGHRGNCGAIAAFYSRRSCWKAPAHTWGPGG
jgi:hypothetical protein